MPLSNFFSSYFWCVPLAYFVFFLLLEYTIVKFCFLFPAGVCDYLVLISSYLLLVHALAVPFFLHLIAAGACAYFILFSFCCYCVPLSNFVFVLLLVYVLILSCFLFVIAACPCPILFSSYFWCVPLAYFVFFLLLEHAIVQFCFLSLLVYVITSF